jgi:hypothetical protein
MADGAHGILWRRLDGPGHEAAWLDLTGAGPRLAGTAVFGHVGAPCTLRYEIECDAAWRTIAARVSGLIAGRPVGAVIAVDGARRWRLDGVEVAAVAGCEDLDLEWSPATNLLPIRRLGLAAGQAAPVRSAWLRFPALALERLDQRYRRVGPAAYRYDVADGSFGADLTVDAAGFVTRYPGLWQAE